jgi:hypothetical protein
MRKFLCGMVLCAILLTGCQSASKKTDTPAAPAHNIPPAVYPAPKSESPVDAGQANQVYPAPQDNSAASAIAPGDAYPAPSTSAGSAAVINEYAPSAGDENMDRGNASVEIDSSSVVLLESDPKQVKLHLVGTLPNPCYHLRVNPSQPDDQKHIQVEVYSVSKPGEVCTDVIQDFVVEIPLGSFPAGHYSIYINEELLGEFDA